MCFASVEVQFKRDRQREEDGKKYLLFNYRHYVVDHSNEHLVSAISKSIIHFIVCKYISIWFSSSSFRVCPI